MRRQPDCGATTAAAALSAPASRRAGGPNLGPGSMLAALSCRGPESKAPSSSPLAAGAAGPPSLAGGLTPMAHQPPAEERLLPNGNVCHFAGCGCADGVSGEIRAALKECVSNMRQQQQLQQQEQQLRIQQHHHGHQQQQQQSGGGLCGCPVLLRGACEHQARPASSASNNAASSQPAAPLKSLLKRASTTRPRRGSRVRFSDTLTVFSEDYPEAQLYVIRTAELTFAEVCAMYEPPPEYRDLPPFDPPDGYRDDAYLLPFLKEARAAAAAARAAAAAAASQQASQAGGIPAASAQVGAQQQQQQQPSPQQHQQHQQGTTVQHTPAAPTTTPVQIRVVERPPPPPPPPRTTPVATGPPVAVAEDRGGGKVEDETQLLPPPTAEILEDLAKTAALEEAQRKGEKDTQKRGEDTRIVQERPSVVADVKPTTAVVVVSPGDSDGSRPSPGENILRKVIVVDEEEDDEDVKRRDESSPVLPEDEDDAILLELKKQLECNSSGDIEADLAELLPPGLIVDDVSRKAVADVVDDLKVVRHRPTVEVRPLSFRQPVPLATTPASPAATTPSTASSTPDERQEDSDSSADSQDTIILMTNEEEKKAEEANEHRSTGGFRHKLLIIGDKSPSDTSSVSSSASQDSDGSMRSSESTTNSEDRTESPTGSSGSSSGGGGCGGRGHIVVEDDIYNDDLDALLEYGPHSNLQVRRTIERTAMRRSLTRVTDVRKRTPTNLAKSPTSSNDVSLVEKLRWLTSLDDDKDDGCSDDSEAAADHHHHHHHHQGPPPPPPVARRPPPDPGFVQDAGRTLPGYPRGGLNGAFQPRPASFSQLSDACRGSLTMLPVAARDYRMVRRVPGENHPQQNTGVASQRAQPPPPPVRRPAPQGSGGVSVGNSAKDAPPDELERFVQQDMERTERIRKRYSLSEEDEDPSFGFARRPSVRGIRSRFGSSAELMKDVQQMMHHPAMSMPGSHLSWSHPVELPPPNHKTPQQVKVMLLPRVAEEDTGRNYGSAGDIATLTRSRRAFQPAPSPVPPSTSSLSAAKDERGVPEGACSSPKVSSEPGYQGQPPQQPKSGPVSAPPATPPSLASAGPEAAAPPPPQGVVYYSLNV